MEKVKFIYNPFAGDHYIVDQLDELIALHQEYGYFLVDEDYLADIIYAQEHQLDIDDVIRDAENNLPMAARAEKADQTKKIQDWLNDIEDK